MCLGVPRTCPGAGGTLQIRLGNDVLSYQPFDAATPQTLYPDYGSYVSLVLAATLDSLSNGFMVMEDAIETMREAAQSDIGMR